MSRRIESYAYMRVEKMLRVCVNEELKRLDFEKIYYYSAKEKFILAGVRLRGRLAGAASFPFTTHS